MRGPSWSEIEAGVRELRVGPLPLSKDELGRVEEALHDFRRDARERILRGLHQQLGEDFWIRYNNIAAYHARVDALIQIIVGVLFDERILTRDEADMRIAGFETILDQTTLQNLLGPA